jgi:hypothetical protein
MESTLLQYIYEAIQREEVMTKHCDCTASSCLKKKRMDGWMDGPEIIDLIDDRSM